MNQTPFRVVNDKKTDTVFSKGFLRGNFYYTSLDTDKSVKWSCTVTGLKECCFEKQPAYLS